MPDLLRRHAALVVYAVLAVGGLAFGLIGLSSPRTIVSKPFSVAAGHNAYGNVIDLTCERPPCDLSIEDWKKIKDDVDHGRIVRVLGDPE